MLEVRTCARLHLGLLDNNGGQGRLYGSIGVAVDAPNFILEAESAPALVVEGLESERVLDYARRFLSFYGLSTGARLKTAASIPAHVGLGSGTQLGLAVGSLLAKLNGLRLAVSDIALAVGRGQHSGIGIATFQHGGFVLDGGRRLAVSPSDHMSANTSRQFAEKNRIPPVLFKKPMPRNWYFVVVIPTAEAGLCGAKEKGAFQQLPIAPESVVEKISWILLMKMLPALVEEDIASFGQALTSIQYRVGDCFSSVQGGRFASPLLEKLVEFLLEKGAAGAGQSSWGPAIYGLVEGKAKAQRLAEEAQAFINNLGGGQSYYVQPYNRGARVMEINQAS
jgi:beta-ribofuranosylaminobenzene 5'-phosphate synthase